MRSLLLLLLLFCSLSLLAQEKIQYRILSTSSYSPGSFQSKSKKSYSFKYGTEDYIPFGNNGDNLKCYLDKFESSSKLLRKARHTSKFGKISALTGLAIFLSTAIYVLTAQNDQNISIFIITANASWVVGGSIYGITKTTTPRNIIKAIDEYNYQVDLNTQQSYLDCKPYVPVLRCSIDLD